MGVNYRTMMKDIEDNENYGAEKFTSSIGANDAMIHVGNRIATAYTHSEVGYWILSLAHLTYIKTVPPYFRAEPIVYKGSPQDWWDARTKVCQWLFQGICP